MSELRLKTIQGVLWSGASVAGREVLVFVTTLLLMRLLGPEEFGIMAMIIVFTGFTTILLNFGFGKAIIQHANVTVEDLSSLFWLNMFIGLVLGLLVFGLGGPIARFYEQPELKTYTQVLASAYVFSSLGIVPKAMIHKELQFKKNAIIEAVTAIAAGTAAVILAFRDYGVWALVVQSVLTAFIMSALLLAAVDWRPAFIFRTASIRKYLSFSVNLFGNETVKYWSLNVDKLVVGKFMGEAILGYYKNSYSIVLRPVVSLNTIFVRVMFPAFSKLQHDRPVIIRYYFRLVEYIFLALCPLAIALVFLSEEIVLLLFGAQWMYMAKFLPWFAFGGMFLSLAEINSSVYLALGKSRLLFYVKLIGRIILIGGIFAAVFVGPVAVAIAFCLGLFVGYGIDLFYVQKILGFEYIGYAKCLYKASRPALILGPLTAVLAIFISSPLVLIIVFSVLLVLIYGVYLRYSGILKELIAMRARRPKKEK